MHVPHHNHSRYVPCCPPGGWTLCVKPRMHPQRTCLSKLSPSAAAMAASRADSLSPAGGLKWYTAAMSFRGRRQGA
jgi:hypothetical protein